MIDYFFAGLGVFERCIQAVEWLAVEIVDQI